MGVHKLLVNVTKSYCYKTLDGWLIAYMRINLLLQVKESEVREAEVRKDAMTTKLGDLEMASQVWRRRKENTYLCCTMTEACDEHGNKAITVHVLCVYHLVRPKKSSCWCYRTDWSRQTSRWVCLLFTINKCMHLCAVIFWVIKSGLHDHKVLLVSNFQSMNTKLLHSRECQQRVHGWTGIPPPPPHTHTYTQLQQAGEHTQKLEQALHESEVSRTS